MELFGQRHDDFLRSVPTQTGFDRDGQFHCVDHSTGNLQHERHVLQHARTGSFAGHALHRTTEIKVDDVGMGALFDNLGGVANGNGVFAVDLYDHGALFVTHGEFVETATHHAYEGVGRHKFRVDH